MAKVTLEHLTKYFGVVVAVEDLSMQVRDKEFLVLLGPSGCGKTTTLRCIAGLETPTKGNIYLDDVLINDLLPQDRGIAMVFQSYALYPHMTVYANIAFPLKLRKVPENEIKKRVKETAELLRIEHLLDRKPRELSGGEKQRTAVGRAIIRYPEVFLLDEPLSNLDAKLRVQMRADLKKLQRELGVTTIYVTHDQVEAMSMAERIAVLQHGKLQQLTSPNDLYFHPANLFVSGFIGSPPMNFFEGSFVEDGGKAFFDAGVFTLEFLDAQKQVIKELSTGSELILGIRPENISMHKEPKPEAIKAKIYVVEPLGLETIVSLKLGDTLIKMRTQLGVEAESGDERWVTFNKDKIYIFDKGNGNTIM